MGEKIDDGGPAFPTITSPGMSRRDWFAAHAPEPTQEQIAYLADRDRLANPHGDNYKPPRRSIEEIVTDIKFKYADAMIAASKRVPR